MRNRLGVSLSSPKKAAIAVWTALAVGLPVVGMLTAPLQAQSLKKSTDPIALIRTKETVLKYSLFKMREAIDSYLAAKSSILTA